MEHTIKEIWNIIPKRLQGFSLSIPLMVYIQLTEFINNLVLGTNVEFWFALLNVMVILTLAIELTPWLINYKRFTNN